MTQVSEPRPRPCCGQQNQIPAWISAALLVVVSSVPAARSDVRSSPSGLDIGARIACQASIDETL